MTASIPLLIALGGRAFSAVPDYKIGDTANEDIATPLQLIVLDPEATQKLRQQEAARVPAIFRFYPEAVDEAETRLRSRFAATREKFLNSLEAAFGQRQLGPAIITNARFGRFINSFQRQNKAFPLTTNLAQVWAGGESDESIVTTLAETLREIMARAIRADALPAEGRIGPGRVLMVSLKASDGPLDSETVVKQGVPLFKTNLVQIGRLRKELPGRFSPEEQATAKFLAGLLRPNCVFEEELTRQSRAKRTEPIWAADQYEPGQLLAKRGQLIDAKTKAALDQLRAKTAVDEVKAQAAEEQVRSQLKLAALREQATLAEEKARTTRRRNQALLIGLIFFAGAFAWTFWRRIRRKTSRTMLPARVAHELDSPKSAEALVISCPNCTETIVVPVTPRELELPQTAESLGQGALLANQRQRSIALIRKSLVPQLARWLMTRVVRGLIQQGSQLIDTQRAAELELAQLEKRLRRMNAPLEERLKAYENRITELEKELTAKTEENHELIRAQIDLTRQKLEMERSKEPLAWN